MLWPEEKRAERGAGTRSKCTPIENHPGRVAIRRGLQLAAEVRSGLALPARSPSDRGSTGQRQEADLGQQYDADGIPDTDSGALNTPAELCSGSRVRCTAYWAATQARSLRSPLLAITLPCVSSQRKENPGSETEIDHV